MVWEIVFLDWGKGNVTEVFGFFWFLGNRWRDGGLGGGCWKFMDVVRKDPRRLCELLSCWRSWWIECCR